MIKAPNWKAGCLALAESLGERDAMIAHANALM